MQPTGSEPIGPRYDFADVTLGGLLQRGAELWPDREAFVTMNERLTYADLLHEAESFARSLRALGVSAGDNVCSMLPNGIDAIVAMFGIGLAGAVYVPVNTRFRQTELEFVLSDAAPTVVVTNDEIAAYQDFVPLLHTALPALAQAPDVLALHLESAPGLRAAVLLGSSRADGFVDDATFRALRTTDELPTPAVGDLAAIVYTSGTTSNPRGALLTHRALVGHWASVAKLWHLEPEDRFWNPCPLFHIAGIGPVMWTFGAGASFITHTHFDATLALAQIEAERATVLYPTYPPIMRDIMSNPNFTTTDQSTVRALLPKTCGPCRRRFRTPRRSRSTAAPRAARSRCMTSTTTSKCASRRMDERTGTSRSGSPIPRPERR
jgi:acyl-CoA synthetase (AMP-forming)/AMP-acid ligase II